MNLNKIFILGRLTADPQLRTTPSGQSVTSFAVATNRIWTDKSGSRKESAEYHNVVAWGKQAEIASQFLTKGSMVLVEGRLQTRSWQTRQGEQRKTTEVICERLQLGPRRSGSGEGKVAPGAEVREAQPLPVEEVPVIDLEETKEEINPEDLPF